MIQSKKNRGTTGWSNKSKNRFTSRLTNKIQKKLCKLRTENKFTNKTYFELYPSGPFHRVYMEQSKRINRKKLSYASHCIYNRYAALWNIKISCRYHSAGTQQKPTQSIKLKIICFASSNMKNWTRWNPSFIWCHKPLSINTHRLSNWFNPAEMMRRLWRA